MRSKGLARAVMPIAMMAAALGVAGAAVAPQKAAAPAPRVQIASGQTQRQKKFKKEPRFYMGPARGTPFRKIGQKNRSPRMRWDRRPPQALDIDIAHCMNLPIDVYLDGRKTLYAVAYNIQEGWVRVYDRDGFNDGKYPNLPHESPLPQLILKGKVTIKWQTKEVDGRDFKCIRVQPSESSPQSRAWVRREVSVG